MTIRQRSDSPKIQNETMGLMEQEQSNSGVQSQPPQPPQPTEATPAEGGCIPPPQQVIPPAPFNPLPPAPTPASFPVNVPANGSPQHMSAPQPPQQPATSLNLQQLQDPSTFQLDPNPKSKKITKSAFESNQSGLSANVDTNDPLSQLDPLWTQK